MNCSARCLCFIDHLFLTFVFRQVPCWNFLQFFPFLVHRCFPCRNFQSLRHRNKFVNQIVMLQSMNSHLLLQYDLDGFGASNFHTHSGGFIGFQNTRKFCLIFVRSTTPTILYNFTGHSRSNSCFQLLTCVLDGFLEFLILGVVKMNLFLRPLLLFLQLGILSHWLPELWP